MKKLIVENLGLKKVEHNLVQTNASLKGHNTINYS